MPRGHRLAAFRDLAAGPGVKRGQHELCADGEELSHLYGWFIEGRLEGEV